MTDPSRPLADSGQIEAIHRFYGAEPRVSEWFTISQELVDQFGLATGDRQWIHTDAERAGRESPFGGTIAHGFFTLSLLTQLSRGAEGANFPLGAVMAFNYGLNRVRFPAPVRVGARIRNHSRLLDVAIRGTSQYLVTTENTVEIAGGEKPALVAEWLILLQFAGS